MSDVKLEDDVRRSLRAVADALVVDDRDFDPGRVAMVEPPEPFREHRNRRLMLVAAAVAIVLVAGTVIVRGTSTSNSGIKVAGSPTTTEANSTTTATGASGGSGPIVGSQPAPADLVAKVVSVPVSVLDAVRAGTASPIPTKLLDPVLTEDGKPRLVWIGAENCPYCAAERWPLVVALSRFGTFSNLGVTTSTTRDVFPDTPSFSFHGATYSSQYVAFDAVETATNVPTSYAPTCPPPGACSPLASAGYTSLDAPTADERALYEKYDAPPYTPAEDAGAIPFLDFANRYLTVGATFSPEVLEGKSFDEIASALSDPTSAIAKGIDGRANVITAVLCKLTNNQPVIVCADPLIASLESQIT